MKPVTRELLSLLDSLHPEPVRLIGGPAHKSRRSDPLDVLEEVRRSHQVAAIPYVAFLLAHPKRKVAVRASEVVAALVSEIKGVGFARLDAWMRTFAPWNHAALKAWLQVDPNDLRVLPEWQTAVGIASMHHDGRRREAALRLLAASRSGAEMPFIMVRLNDWVRQVRALAYSLIKNRMRGDHAPHFARHLGLLMRLERCERSYHGRLLSQVSELLKSPGARTSLIDTLCLADPLASRLSFKLLTEPPTRDYPGVIAKALTSKHPVVRLWAAKNVMASGRGDLIDDMLPGIRRDRFMPVRREALLREIDHDPKGCLDALKRAMLDRSVSMRQTARYYAEKLFAFDAAAFYREALPEADGARLASAILSLGETGRTQDIARILPFREHRTTRIRRAAIRALARLCGRERVEEFLSALEDQKGSVSREARKALAPRAASVGGERLWGLVSGSRTRHVRRNALRVLAALRRWQQLPYLIRACGLRDEEVAGLAAGLLRTWIWKCRQANATPQEAAAASKAIDENERALEKAIGADLIEELRFAIG